MLTWNWPIRISHWLVAASILLNALLIEGGDLHDAIGYLCWALVALRIGYGFFKHSGAASFQNFPVGLKSTFSFLASLIHRNIKIFKGHNPLASWTYLVMWSLIFALGITGYMMSIEKYWGEEWLEELHLNCSRGLLVLFALHILGILHDAFHFKRATWMGMIHGKK